MVNTKEMQNNSTIHELCIYECGRCGKQFKSCDGEAARLDAEDCCTERMKKSRARIWCRDCGEGMKIAPYGILVFFCKKCRLKAEVEYRQTPIMRTITLNNAMSEINPPKRCICSEGIHNGNEHDCACECHKNNEDK